MRLRKRLVIEMTPKFIMMVGLPASGKSTYAKKLAKEYDANIHSSDAIREELSGDINNQNINELVFKTLHNRIKEDLKNGRSCIYDATNISYKRRMVFLEELKNIPCEKICELIATPYEECLKRNAERERKVPEYVIERMYRSFDVPHRYEGWNCIATNFGLYRATYGTPYEWISTVRQYNQHNSHHELSLGEHCWQTYKSIKKSCYTNTNHDIIMRTSGMLHDCGKCFCQTFVNTKNEITNEAHYYAHERVGSYDSLFYGMTCNPLDVAIRIRWHMQPYFWEKDNNERLHNKYRKLWGENLYNDIMLLHEADKAAH